MTFTPQSTLNHRNRINRYPALSSIIFSQLTKVMKTRGRWCLCLRVILTVAAVSTWWGVGDADPQINLLNRGCSQYNASNIPDFFNNLNATYADLRTQLSSAGGSKRFATAQRARSSDPVYALAQCRNYMSEPDCLACYDAAVAQIRNCSAGNGARVIYDGCFLRYESNFFYDQTTLPGNVQICGNRTLSPAVAFSAQARTLLQDLELATPRINKYYAATKSEATSGGNLTVYGVAQCAETISQSGCQDCLTVAYRNIQSCLPDAAGRAIDAACFLRYSETPFFSDNQTTDISSFLGGGGNSSKTKAIVGGVVGGSGLVFIVIVLFLWFHLSRKEKKTGNILGAMELQGPNVYSYKDLKSATDNFSKENKLGEGAFGEVYKATLKNGNIVAVKKLNISNNHAKGEFESEVRLISNVHHRNIIRLLGCCNKESELLLVYEYMANGSLDKFLYGDKRGALSWKQRLDIIIGMARGLAYLHEQYHVCIVHRDIKPSNVLLDDEFQAKISDFGLARLFPENQSHVSSKFAGTLGYTAPEYAVNGHLSEKVDTYSFGVVILEIISGRRSSDVDMESDTQYLLEEAWKLYGDGMPEKLADETLGSDDYKPEDLKKIVELALICLQSPSSSRPTMSEVLVMLLNDHSWSQERTPNRSSSVFLGKRSSADSSISAGSSTSNATASISQFTGR